MKIVETRFLRGPNLYSPRPCFHAVLDLEDLDEVASDVVPGFVDALCTLLPTLDEHRCSLGYRGGFVERLREGTYMAHVTEHVLLELQCLVGPVTGFGKARMIRHRPRHYRIVCSYHSEKLVEAALPVAVGLVDALGHGRAYDLEAHLAELREVAERYLPGPSTRSIVEAANRRGIPFYRVREDQGLYQLGWGVKMQTIRATVTSKTGFLAVEHAGDKQFTKALLEECGLPVPKGGIARSIGEAFEIAERVGGDLAVKPLDANQGKGVTLHVKSAGDMQRAFERAQQYSREVIVEQCLSGADYRVLVVGGRMVAASRREPPCVVGDGRRSIKELVDRENNNPLRGEGHANVLTKIRLDAHAEAFLQARGLSPFSVPRAGQKVALRDNANLSTGGTAEDVTDLVHPETREACIRAALKIGLDVAGIDLVCQDIARPLGEQGGAIIEVNAAPGIRMHEWPSKGEPRQAGRAIVDHLFPQGDDGRIPVVAVTGTNGKTTTTLLIGRAFGEAGRRVGMTLTEGIHIGGRLVQSGDCTGYWSARTVLTAPDVEVAVLECARGGILKRGLGFDRCDVAVMLNISADHLGQDGIDDLDDLADVKAVVARSARRALVLNAEDPLVAAMAQDEDVDPQAEIVYFSLDPRLPLVRDHAAAGGRALVLDGGALTLLQDGRAEPLIPVDVMPFTLGGQARFNVANALAAAAGALAAGCPRDAVRRAFEGFRSAAAENPLRMNFLDVGELRVLVDYAHNPASYRALLETARACCGGRLIVVAAAPGDRRADDIAEMGRILAQGSDELIVYEMDDRRGLAPGEAARKVCAGIDVTRRDRVRTVLDVRDALAEALAIATPDDLVVFGCASDFADLEQAASRSGRRVPALHAEGMEMRRSAVS